MGGAARRQRAATGQRGRRDAAGGHRGGPRRRLTSTTPSGSHGTCPPVEYGRRSRSAAYEPAGPPARGRSGRDLGYAGRAGSGWRAGPATAPARVPAARGLQQQPGRRWSRSAARADAGGLACRRDGASARRRADPVAAAGLRAGRAALNRLRAEVGQGRGRAGPGGHRAGDRAALPRPRAARRRARGRQDAAWSARLSAPLALDTKRLQFTPDLMPGDVTGSLVYRRADGRVLVPRRARSSPTCCSPTRSTARRPRPRPRCWRRWRSGRSRSRASRARCRTRSSWSRPRTRSSTRGRTRCPRRSSTGSCSS